MDIVFAGFSFETVVHSTFGYYLCFSVYFCRNRVHFHLIFILFFLIPISLPILLIFLIELEDKFILFLFLRVDVLPLIIDIHQINIDIFTRGVGSR